MGLEHYIVISGFSILDAKPYTTVQLMAAVIYTRLLFRHSSCMVQGFAESLQQDSSNQSEIVMMKLYCCGPDYCSIYPLLYYFFQIRNGLGSSVFKLCCKDSAKPCTTDGHHDIGCVTFTLATTPNLLYTHSYWCRCYCQAKRACMLMPSEITVDTGDFRISSTKAVL